MMRERIIKQGESTFAKYRHIRNSSLCAGSFSVLVSANLGLYRVPIDLDISRILFKLVNILFLRILLQETGTIGNNCVNMRLVIESNVEGSLPTVKLNVHLDGSVEEAGL
jgi:hypothetical protein